MKIIKVDFKSILLEYSQKKTTCFNQSRQCGARCIVTTFERCTELDLASECFRRLHNGVTTSIRSLRSHFRMKHKLAFNQTAKDTSNRTIYDPHSSLNQLTKTLPQFEDSHESKANVIKSEIPNTQVLQSLICPEEENTRLFQIEISEKNPGSTGRGEVHKYGPAFLPSL